MDAYSKAERRLLAAAASPEATAKQLRIISVGCALGAVAGLLGVVVSAYGMGRGSVEASLPFAIIGMGWFCWGLSMRAWVRERRAAASLVRKLMRSDQGDE